MAIFPGTDTAAEGTTKDFWAQWDPNAGDTSSKVLSITADPSALNDVADDTYQVLGSNIGSAGADAVPVADDLGSDAARALNKPFSRANWPYKWICIRYTKGSGTTTGTFTFYINTSAQLNNLT